MQTFLCQLLRGHNENQFFHYFLSLLVIYLLHHQNLPSKWFERRLKRKAMFLPIFGKAISPSCFCCVNSQGDFEMTLELFGYQ